MRATVHVGPQGGTEYRLWTGPDTFRVVGKYKAWPHMTVEERDKAEALESARKAKLTEQRERDANWRAIQAGRSRF